MQVLPRWRNILILRNTIVQSARVAAVTTPSTTQLALFHSTDPLFGKWRSKFIPDSNRDQQPSKNYIRYAVRQKRAETKKLLRNILFKGGCSKSGPESFERLEADFEDHLNKKNRLKSTRGAKKAKRQTMRRKQRREEYFEEFDEDENPFHAKFGRNGFTWTFSDSEFHWTENSDWTHFSFREQDRRSRIENNNNSFFLRRYADRQILGLPTAGPLKIEDVKAAFRLSALKWHPDKHQGSSKADAEEKFKHCVNAYKSLCQALSAA